MTGFSLADVGKSSMGMKKSWFSLKFDKKPLFCWLAKYIYVYLSSETFGVRIVPLMMFIYNSIIFISFLTDFLEILCDIALFSLLFFQKKNFCSIFLAIPSPLPTHHASMRSSISYFSAFMANKSRLVLHVVVVTAR